VKKKQLLTDEQENTLVAWTVHHAEMGLPFAISDIRVEASVVSGKPVGKLWVKQFLM
jgi:hypothetical protein